MHKTIYLLLTMIGLYSPIIVYGEDLKQPSDVIARHVHVRSLAASCASCHGTNGNDAENNVTDTHLAKLAGMDTKYFITQMLAFKSGERVATVMHHHAKGLNSDEISDLAEYFSAQVPKTSALLHAQKLSAQSSN